MFIVKKVRKPNSIKFDKRKLNYVKLRNRLSIFYFDSIKLY